MVPMNLEIKQEKLLEKNRELRREQNRRNASGPRKAVNQPTERTPRSVLPALRKRISNPETPDRYVAYYVYCIECLEKDQQVATYCEFYKQFSKEEEPNDSIIPQDFQIRELSLASN